MLAYKVHVGMSANLPQHEATPCELVFCKAKTALRTLISSVYGRCESSVNTRPQHGSCQKHATHNTARWISMVGTALWLALQCFRV